MPEGLVRKNESLDIAFKWVNGRPKREFLHLEDMALRCLHVINLGRGECEPRVVPMFSHINVHAGQDCFILELAEMIADIVGFHGGVYY